MGEVKNGAGWSADGWAEVVAKRGLHSKTYKDPGSGTHRFIANTKGAPRHYRADGVRGTGALTDIDLTNPDNIQTFYLLERLAGTAIGYQYTPRDKTDLTIIIRLEGYTGTGEADEQGQVWYRDIATDLDIYSKPLPYRYGIFKVLKGPSAPTSFVFNGSATGEPQAINDAFGGSWTMKQLQQLSKIEDINAIVWDANGAEVLIPARVAWDGNGEPVQVKVTAEYVPSTKSIKLTEQVVLGDNPVWPITVDTDVSYNSTTDDGHIYGRNATYSTARTVGHVVAATLENFVIGQIPPGTYYFVYRAAVFFPTGEIAESSVVLAADIVLRGVSDNSADDFTLSVVAYTGSSTLATSEFNEFGSTSYGDWDSADYATVNTITLNATGRAAINKTGDTPFGLRSQEDINASAPTANEYVYFRSAESTDVPKIDITYEPSVTLSAEQVGAIHRITITR